MKRDAYILFFERFKISEEALLAFGREQVVLLPADAIYEHWLKLVSDIRERKPVWVRGCGRQQSSQEIANALYAELFPGLQIKVDPTNNMRPRNRMNSLLKCHYQERFENFQTSHVWGKTKSPYAFTGMWNVVLIPKVLDPFSGHEARGPFVEQFQQMLRHLVHERYKRSIDEHNELVGPMRDRVIAWVRVQGERERERLHVSQMQFKNIAKALVDSFTPAMLSTL